MSQIPPTPPFPPPGPLPYATPVFGTSATDLAHVNTLGICHYVWGGLVGLGSCLGLLYFFLGLMISMGKFPTSQPGMPPNAPPADRIAAVAFMVFGGGLTLFGWVCCVLNIYAGRCLRSYRGRVYCMIIAGINCLSMPFGTVLGIFTLIVLSRSTVQQLFSAQKPA